MVANTLDSSSAGGIQGAPTPAPSDPQNGQPPSTSAPTQSPDQMRALVADVVREALQDENILKGMKDRRFNLFQRTLDDISPVLERVKEILSPEQQQQLSQIQRDAEFDELKRTVYGNPNTQTGVIQSGTPNSAAVDVEAIVKSFFEPNDPTFAALQKKHAGKPAEFLREAMQSRIAQAQSPNPSPASLLSQTGQAATGLTPEQADEKGLQLQELYKNATLNKPAIRQLEAELKQAGYIKER